MVVTYNAPDCLHQQLCVAAVLLVLTDLSGDWPLTQEAEGELHSPAQFPAGEWGKPSLRELQPHNRHTADSTAAVLFFFLF